MKNSRFYHKKEVVNLNRTYMVNYTNLCSTSVKCAES